jgi:hypothetical protein
MTQYFKSNLSNPDSVYIKYDITENTSGIISTVSQRITPITGSTPPSGSQPITQITFQVISGSVYDSPPRGPLMNTQISRVISSDFLNQFLTCSQEEYDTFINSTFELYKTY